MQFLEKENTRLESELQNVLKDLNEHKDHNDVMRHKVAHLEMNLKHNKVSVKLYFNSSNIMCPGACIYMHMEFYSSTEGKMHLLLLLG